MILKFFGVRGSYPVSGKSYLKYGGHTPSILIETSSKIIIFDGGTGIIEAGNYIVSNNNSKEIHIFISHLHYDHIHGLPFFKPFLTKRPIKIRIYGPKFDKKSFEEQINSFFSSPFVPFSLKTLKNVSNISFISYDKEIFKTEIEDNIRINAKHCKNHPRYGVYMLSILAENKKITYITDLNLTENSTKKITDFAINSDILIFDSFFTDTEKNLAPELVNFGHSSFEDSIKIKKISKSIDLFFFHLNPSYKDEELDKIKKRYCTKNIQIAVEGMEVKL